MGKKLSAEALAVLGSMTTTDNLATITAGQLPPRLYKEVNGAIEALGGKWNRKLGGHIFEGDPRDALDQVVLTGEFSSRRQDFGFFETPGPLAARVVEMARIRPDMMVLEPSCGRGALIKEVFAQQPGTRIHGVEIQLDNAIRCRLLGAEVEQADFLQVVAAPCDRVVMNPPFARQADIDHVQHAFEMLRPGGRLVSIMSAGVKFRENQKTVAFRALLEQNDGEIIDLPPGSFAESGTGVNTVIVTLDKAA